MCIMKWHGNLILRMALAWRIMEFGHQSLDFKWKDYCPMVFRYLRETFKIVAIDYMLSICGNDGMRGLSSPGKSGTFSISLMMSAT